MGVHLTFVRSVDLDEWTQRQIDAMKIGGNGPAREYFRKHGMSMDGTSGKGAEKKYTSKAAQMYRSQLEKLVEAEAKKRGEGTGEPAEVDENVEVTASSLLENLSVEDRRSSEEEARRKLEVARAASSGNHINSTTNAKLASSMPGASKLVVGGNLRKPGTTTTASMMLKKKPMGGGGLSGTSKLRLNNLGGMKLTANGNQSNGDHKAASSDDFEDIESTQQKAAATEIEKKQLDEDEALARRLQDELNSGPALPPSPSRFARASKNGLASNVPNTQETTSNGSHGTGLWGKEAAASQSSSAPASQQSSMDESLAKLKSMTGDFFSQF